MNGRSQTPSIALRDTGAGWMWRVIADDGETLASGFSPDRDGAQRELRAAYAAVEAGGGEHPAIAA